MKRNDGVMLDPPVVERPADTINEHTQGGSTHWDATVWVSDDGGWTWHPVSAVNMPTPERARDWAAGYMK